MNDETVEPTVTQHPSRLLSEVSADYLQASGKKATQATRQEVAKFVRWCGRTCKAGSLTPQAIEEYCGTLGGVGEEGPPRLAIVKGFLVYMHRRGWTATNLAPHAKLRRTGRKTSAARRQRDASSRLTEDGHRRLQEELVGLKAERVNVTKDIRRAAATKDFSENAPLDAAREHQGQMEARIRELEATLKGATILERGKNVRVKVTLGARVVLRHAQTGKELSYLLVESQEADPTAGKLSAASPLGKAVLDRTTGDEVEVLTPRGAVRYLVSKIGG